MSTGSTGSTGGAPGTDPTRRRVLAAAGLLGLAGVAACSGDPAPAPAAPGPGPTSAPAGPPAPTTTSTTPDTYVGDLQVAALGAALSNLAADLYGDAVAAGTRYGAVPAAVTALLQGAAAHHTDAATAWNGLLTTAGRPTVTGSPVTVEADRRAALDAARAPTDLLVLALDLEGLVAATVVARTGELVDLTVVDVAARVAPVVAAHAATAAFLLGRPPGTPPGPAAAPLGRDALTA